MSTMRKRSYEAILASIRSSKLPEPHKDALTEAISQLYAARPNAVDKVQAPLGRALRNPTFPKIWDRCLDDIPGSAHYEALRTAAGGIVTWLGDLD